MTKLKEKKQIKKMIKKWTIKKIETKSRIKKKIYWGTKLKKQKQEND